MSAAPTAAAGQPSREELDRYAAAARAWLEANLQRRSERTTPERTATGGGDLTPEQVAVQRRLQRKVYEAGYAGITWPKEYGGQGLPAAFERAFHNEAKHYVLPDFGNVGGATLGVCAPTMLAHASPAFLRRTIPEFLAGALVSQFFSDPEAGSDLAGVRTTAVKDGDRWILNGSKIWSSGAYYADYGMCLARTDWDVPKHRGLTWFLVPTNAKGVTIERIRQINGNAEFCQEYFTDVELTDDDVIGEVNGGWAVTQTMLLYERGAGLMGAARAGGAPKRQGIARDLHAVAEASGRLGDPLTRDLVARAHVDDLARAALGKRLGARMAADPSSAASLASYGKLASGVFDPVRADLVMQIGRHAALAWEAAGSPANAASLGLLNSRFLAIAGGTSQMQRNTIGEKVLGLPREPSFDAGKPFRDVLRDARNWTGQQG